MRTARHTDNNNYCRCHFKEVLADVTRVVSLMHRFHQMLVQKNPRIKCWHVSASYLSEQSFAAAGGDLSQQMLVQMVYTRDFNQMTSLSELALTLL